MNSLFLERWTKAMRSKWLAWIIAITACGFLPSTHAAEDGRLSFFKQALSSPPDIESFSASLRALRIIPLPKELELQNAVVQNPEKNSYEGARGSNGFYLIDTTIGRMVSGQANAKPYLVSANALSFGLESPHPSRPELNDRIHQSVESSLNLLRQFLQMGLAEIDSKGVTWLGDEFVATNSEGAQEFGRLEISNSLPWRLTVAGQKGGDPLKSFTYFYPEASSKLSGFPETIVISTLASNVLEPFLELKFSQVQISERKLSSDFFNHEKFLNTNIIYTNLYTYNQLVTYSPKGKVTSSMKEIDPNFVDIRPEITFRHWIVYFVIFLLTIVPFLVLLRSRKHKRAQPN